MRKCSVSGCDKKHFANNYCRMHDMRVKRNGSTESKYDKSGYSKLGGVKDIGPGRRGSLAVNQINDIKFKAGKRGLKWELTHEQAFDLIKSKCTYCGLDPKWPEARSGIDRVYSDDHYHANNCVPSCFTCNSAKNDLSLEEFKAWLTRAYKHFIESA